MVDRKFLVGMQRYAEQVRQPLVTVHPELAAGSPIMDSVEVPCAELPYRVMTVKVDAWRRTQPCDVPRLRDEISRCRLVYGGDLGAAELARSLRIPYIPVLEYDLRTHIVASTSTTTNPLRRANRAVRSAWHHLKVTIPQMRNAQSLHCNGYPVYDEAEPYNPKRLLYFDSRMSEDMLISQDELAGRIGNRQRRPLRLLYSGRYERMKGADDAVRSALECLRRGLDIEMHCYGQGSLRAEMDRLAGQARSPGRVQIHDALPYPQLVKISRTFDVFVCCHRQSDPSCTYIESFGAGLPIVGYENRMWQRLSEHSGAGYVMPPGVPEKLAERLQQLASNQTILVDMSSKALAFARQHTFEREFAKRVDALNAATG
ncbi:MAG: glycosyltransferase [Steroidobacteraceae bacterium]